MDVNKYKQPDGSYPEKPKRIWPGCELNLHNYFKTLGDDLNFCPKCGYDVKEYFKNVFKAYHDKADAYNHKERELYINFKFDALTEVGLIGHPKADEIFDHVWGKQHSYGYNEVMNELEDIKRLFRDDILD